MPAPRHVDHPSARCGEEPGFGCLRDTTCRPAGECRGKGIGERILRGRDIAGPRGEIGYELAIALPRRAFGCPVYVCSVGHITQIGRTSTVP
jgi:hypothetical protein